MGVESAIGQIGTSYQYTVATPSDSTTYTGVKGVAICGAAGDLVVTKPGGGDETIPVLAGMVLPIGFTKVKAASTATGILVMS
ncbi:MAG: hypothetical protein WC670_18890 [Pseudolabrys sp.]|jgi:hypothetical protein